ncbi:transmembrane and immunoglobulin domain-containing protein 2-like [Sinocyclocheilus grahami]|uniref:transmembrane and immunoglobulin domain-containing protein 2-like n=1 Tax=Sinocyclocheilus grahami TaxID=75366 RepID=UPI0007AC87F8|nr:PREDICTED: transmembrane and immunoglobulin domain-containing protein 2-like [Sinocyclocheilus grahami]
MTRTSLSTLFVTIWFTGLVPGDVSLPNLGISVWQIPEITAKEGTDVIITCHIKADSHVERIMVKWCQDNQTVPNSTTSYHRSPVNGSGRINATLQLLSVNLNHSGIYYCTAFVDLPTLEPAELGNGTHVYVVPNSTTVTTQTLTMNTVMWSVLSGLGFVLLIICIVCVIHTHYKGHCRIESRAKEALVDVTRGSPCPDAQQTHVVYAALNIPRDSVKSRKENCPAMALISVTCTEDSVTYSEVHLKKGPKDEG